MAKARIYYKMEDKEVLDYDKSSYGFYLEERKASIWIGTEEKRSTKELIEKATDGLKGATWLKEDEKLEFDELDQSIIDFEESNHRMSAQAYYFLRNIYDNYKNEENPMEKLLETIESLDLEKRVS